MSLPDITFEDFSKTLIIDCIYLKSSATDLILDNPGRRTSRDGMRRALVHDIGDGLSINHLNDYPGGVKINNVTQITADNRRAVVPPGGIKMADFEPVVQITGLIEIFNYKLKEGSRRIGPLLKTYMEWEPEESFILQSELRRLNNRVEALEGEVAALKANAGI